MGWKETMREFHGNRFLVSLIISTFLFALALGSGNFLSLQKVYDVEEMNYDIQTNIGSNDLSYLLFLQNPCDVELDNELNQELYDAGRRLSFVETQRGRGSKEARNMREYYSLLEIKHYLFMKDIKEKCGKDYDLILYFYEECDMCQDQGFILKYFKDKYTNVFVYSFDFYSTNEAVKSIKRIYNITGVPGTVINGVTYNEELTREDIEKILGF